MIDQARKQTDKILEDMEKRIYDIYNRAADEISEKWYKYMQSHEKALNGAYKALQAANRSGDATAISEAKAEYERALKNVTLNNDRYKAMLNETTAKLTHTNEVALNYVNGNMAEIYTLNYNEFANQKITGYTFTLVNEQAVRNLAAEDKSLLPAKKIDIPKDLQWNQKAINSEVLQGILQGESISKIANRLEHVTDMNRNSSIRNARTMVTGAENKGRQDSFERAANDGVIMTRRWVATHDDRTRAWHSDLDGVEVDLDEPWENDYGEIMYPGDPTADPANVYNCRCSIRSVVKGFKWNNEEEELYQYHATTSSSISGIINKGLQPNKGHVGKGIYFANSPEEAIEWTTETSTGGKTVLRVKESILDIDKLEKWAANETGYDLAENVYAAVIPFENIEIRVGDDEWWSLARYADQRRNLVYNKLTKTSQKKVDKIVNEEWEEYLKRRRGRQ